MRRAAIAIGILVGLVAPLGASAMQTETYDLRAGLVNARYEGKGTITMKQEANGILLSTGDGTGILLTSGLPGFMPEAASLFLAAARDTEVRFVWTRVGNAFSSVTFRVPAGNTLPISFSLRQQPQWKPTLESVGLLIPPRSQILLNRMDFIRWSWGEKLTEAVKSFFIMDKYRPYSINFVWGPLLALNLIEEHAAFHNLPPQQISATFALNIGLLAVLPLLALWARFRKPPEMRIRFVIRNFIIILLTAWVLMDLRMGSEFLSWVSADRASYIAAPAETRTFRDRDRFYDFAAFVKPYVFDRGSYAFFAQEAWPYLGNMRYLTYPSIPGINVDRDDTWVIYSRPDIGVNDAGQVTIDGQAVSAPGKILARFNQASFVFRTFAPPSRQ